MSLGAFRNSAELKEQLVEPVRAQWNARALAPQSFLSWQRSDEPNSLCGTLGRTEDRAQLEEHTGIPAELALLCEMLVAVGTQKDETSEGFTLEGSDSVLSFGMEWLDTIRPGADLRPVVPLFARYCVDLVLRPDFPLAPYITAEFREVGERIAVLWDQELAGEQVARAQWREVQNAALQADANTTPVWGFRVATFFEAMVWPVESISGEFVGHFEPLLFNWLFFLEMENLTEKERNDREHFLIGWRAMAIAPRDNAGIVDVDPLEALPESQRVMSPEHIMATMERSKTVRELAQGRKDAVLRGLMDTLLTLIRTA